MIPTATSHVFICDVCRQPAAVPLDHPRARTLLRFRQCCVCDSRIQAYLAGVVDPTIQPPPVPREDMRVLVCAVIWSAAVVVSAILWSIFVGR